MKPLTRSTLLFSATCVLGSALWMVFWPYEARRTQLSPTPERSHNPPHPSEPVDLAKLIAELENAPDKTARWKAATKLRQLPVPLFPEALAMTRLETNGHLTLSARVLLACWAGQDGEASASWAWLRFRTGGLWREALEEIGPSWAWHAPDAFAAWTLQRERKDDLSESDALASDQPILDFGMLGSITLWLIPQNSHLAYQVLRHRKGWSSDDVKFAKRLASVAQARDALTAFDNLGQLVPGKFNSNDLHPFGIFARWYDLDPVDFMKSPYACFAPAGDHPIQLDLTKVPDSERMTAANRWIDEAGASSRSGRIVELVKTWAATDPTACFRWLDSLENTTAARQSQINASFEAWNEAHPGKRPDRFDQWPTKRIQAWEDMEILRAIADPK